MLFSGDKSYSPLVCVGQNIETSTGGLIHCLCVSDSGRLAIVEQDPFCFGESVEGFLARIADSISEIRNWNADILDAIAADYFYETEGQAAYVVDVMARHGYLIPPEYRSFTAALEKGISEDDIIIIVAVDKDFIDMRSVEFNCGKLAQSGYIFSLVEKQVVERFAYTSL